MLAGRPVPPRLRLRPGCGPDGDRRRWRELRPAGRCTSRRAPVAGLLIAAAALVVVPAWTGFDGCRAGARAQFLVVRLADVPIALACWLLWRHPSAVGGPSC